MMCAGYYVFVVLHLALSKIGLKILPCDLHALIWM